MAAAAGAASAELVIGWCIFGLLLLVGETLGVPQGLDGGGGSPAVGLRGLDPPRPAPPAPAGAAGALGGGGAAGRGVPAPRCPRGVVPPAAGCVLTRKPRGRTWAILAFCWVYVRKYQSQRESEVVSTITAIFSLAIALITSALLPVDIFLVSYMKNQNGTFKDWANANVSRRIEDTVLYGYYTLYSVILFCVFLWIPFVYFYYEEKDDDDTGKCTILYKALGKQRLIEETVPSSHGAAFVPLNLPDNKNSTEWEKVKFLFEELGSSHGLAALSFSISSLTLIGMLAAIIYTIPPLSSHSESKSGVNNSCVMVSENVDYGKAYGMSALPLNLIKGTRSAAYERLENTEDIEEVEQHIQAIKSKTHVKLGKQHDQEEDGCCEKSMAAPPCEEIVVTLYLPL
ncbi:hypothetical protein J1605_014945 [Eschrichtius robustus]|uniref:Lysosomal cobalamin transport escort protein LMBD1 n=1 Tax=Eschrichtius robustus TaxID=9764 RepID=A0AB34GAM9_ESCRO|nr:hypothetical protein J1605_014945 [Eschrichtius robustus]